MLFWVSMTQVSMSRSYHENHEAAYNSWRFRLLGTIDLNGPFFKTASYLAVVVILPRVEFAHIFVVCINGFRFVTLNSCRLFSHNLSMSGHSSTAWRHNNRTLSDIPGITRSSKNSAISTLFSVSSLRFLSH